jgi:flagellar protein FlaG
VVDMISSISTQETGISINNPVQVPATKNIPGNPLRSEQYSVKEQKKTEEKKEQYTEIDKSNFDKQADKLNQVMDLFNYSIRFTLDDESKRMVVKVVNSETDEVVRQIPPKEMLQLMNRLDQVVGVILDEKV